MDTASLAWTTTTWSFRTDLWAGAIVMAWVAAFIGLDIARGVSAGRRATALRALAGSAIALGAGVWAAHLIVLSDRPLPGVALHYDAWLIFGALVLATLLMALAVQLGTCATRSPAGRTGRAGGKGELHPPPICHRVLAAGLFGAAACAAPVLALIALRLTPGWHVQPGVLELTCGASAVLAFAGFSAFARLCRRGAAAWGWRLMSTTLLAAAVGVADAGVFHALQVQATASTLSPAPLPAATLTALASVGVPLLLISLVLMSLLEAHFRAELRNSRKELQRTAQTDHLTGLPNRAMFESQLQSAVARADRHEHRLALLFINLDGLKSVNESFGQSAGDQVLREMGERLRAMGEGRDLIARAGGDEFLLLMAGNPGAQDAAQHASQVLTRLSAICEVDGEPIAVPCSIGIAMYPEHGAMSKLIAHAAAAMQASKRTGGAAYCFFEARMVAGAREQVALLRDLRHAIEQHEFELFYQPKIHAPSGQITGAEALMRWNHPQRGMVGPAVFIPLAERFGLINALGNWLIEDVCRQIRAWRDQGLRMRVAINLSAHQLRQPDLVSRIADALRRHRIEPGVLTCEITESAAMEDMRITLAVLEQLQAAGVHLSIDDFGTGYSSLSYLRQLAAEELKIDRSFVLDLETSEDARAIVDAVVKLAQALGLKVVAEGVETREQQEILSQLGCNELQGYLFAKPMSAKALALWATKDEGGPSTLAFRPSLFGETQPAPL